MKRILVASGISLYLKQNENVVDSLISNPLINSLGIVNSAGMIDIDKLRCVVKPEVEKAGYMRITLPLLGDVDFTVEDIDTLYRYISEANNQGQKQLVQPVVNNGGIY